jgi:hypothetical protein
MTNIPTLEAMTKALKIRQDVINEYSNSITILRQRIEPLIEYDVEAKKALHTLISIKTQLVINELVLGTLLLAHTQSMLEINKLFGKPEVQK